MKKILFLILLTSVLMLPACNSITRINTMLIKPSKFSQETQAILELFEYEIMFLDYTIDETVKSHSISLWLYNNGEWVEVGKTYGNIEFLGNQIAIRLTEDSYDLFSIDESGYIKSSYSSIGSDFSDSISTASSQLSNPTPITLNKEIPLWIKLGTNKTDLSIGTHDDFRDSDCNAGVAVTITFSDKAVE